MALSSLSARRGGLLAGPAAAFLRTRPPTSAASCAATAAVASSAPHAPVRGPWVRSYSWYAARAAAASSSSLLLHAPSRRRDERSTQQSTLARLASQARMGTPVTGMTLVCQQQVRGLHATRRQENLVVGGLVVAGTALALQYGLKAYNQYQAKKAAEAAAGGGTASSGGGGGGMSALFAKRFYEGGFEDKMTRREAALILGVRESASAQRIKEAHRRILMLNHPDTGGSTYIASKINEAKEMLLKGKT